MTTIEQLRSLYYNSSTDSLTFLSTPNFTPSASTRYLDIAFEKKLLMALDLRALCKSVLIMKYDRVNTYPINNARVFREERPYSLIKGRLYGTLLVKDIFQARL